MTDALERVLLTPNGGLPTGNYPKAALVEYIRADLVPAWRTDMDAAPKDGTRILTFHPANPDASIVPARRDNIVWNAMKAGQWWYSLPEQPPTHWMHVDPPKGE